MFKPIPDYANEAYEAVPASYPAGWWTVTAHGIPIRHFGDKGMAERYASDPEYRASVVETVAAAVSDGRTCCDAVALPRFSATALKRC